jgi:hypothetical protein
MKFAEQLCERTGFVYDPDAYLYYKEIDGYQFAMSFYSSQFYLMSCVCLDGAVPQAKQIKKDVKENDEVKKAIKDVSVQGYRTVYIIKPAFSQAKLIENICKAIRFVPAYYREKGYQNCCEYCGKVMDTGIYKFGNAARFLCDDDYRTMSEKVFTAMAEAEQVEGSVLAGSVGAFLGSLIGAAAIVLFGQLGFVSVLSGVIMGVCALRGYELLGKKMNVAGVIISCLIMVAMCYFANRLDWSIAVARALEWNIADAFMQCEDVCRYSEVIGSYYASLAQILLFTLLGALPQALSAIRSRKNETIVSVISAAKKGVEE